MRGADISGSFVCFCHQSLVGAGLGSWLVGLGVGSSVASLAMVACWLGGERLCFFFGCLGFVGCG